MLLGLKGGLIIIFSLVANTTERIVHNGKILKKST